MKKIISFSISFLLFVITGHSQLSFIMNASACVNSSVQATAISGTISSPNYTWSSSPAGIIFSSTNSASPIMTFTAAGNYTVVASVTSGTVINFAQNTINVIALPNNLVGIANPSLVCPGYSSTITAFGANSYTWIGASATVANQPSISVGYVSSPTTYTLIGSNVGACTIQTTALVIPNPNGGLTLGINASTPTTCIQDNTYKVSKPVVLTASGANNYVWLPPYLPTLPPFSGMSYTVRPSVTTQYTLLGNTTNCSGTKVITITVIPQFTIAVSPTQTNICAGNAITLSLTQTGQPSFGPYTYSWTEQDQLITTLNTAFSPTVLASPSSKRTYSMEIRDGNSCVSAPTSVTIDVSSCTEIVENSKFNLGAAFPNPFDKELFIQNNTSIFHIELKDGLGKLILSKAKSSQEGLEVIKTENLSPGIYLLHIFSLHEKVQILKVIKN